jgi:translation initiation factor eIF-2B subunit beta
MRELTEARNKLVFNVKHAVLKGSLDIAQSTATFVEMIASSDEWTVASELLRLVNEEGNKLTAALPLHVTVANVVLQLLHIIRVEYLLAVNKSTQAVQRFVESCMNYDEKFSAKCDGLKEAILDHINEYQTDLELSVDNITEQATHQIQSGDVIMTIGRSSIVEAFLLSKAKEKRADFEVVVVEGAPQCKVIFFWIF